MDLLKDFSNSIDKYIDDRRTAETIAEEILEILKSKPIYDIIEELQSK